MELDHYFILELIDSFVFASEIKSFIRISGNKSKISQKHFQNILRFGHLYLQIQLLKVFLKSLLVSYMGINSKGKKINKYWELPVIKPNEYKY